MVKMKNMSSPARPPRASSLHTKSQLKTAARSLFAKYGIDGVTVQQIVAAAGVRNNAALHYHFGSKEELIREVVIDGAAVLNARRQQMLRDLKVRGGPVTIREVLEVLVLPVIELEDDAQWRGYIRFTSSLQASNREVLLSALSNKWNAGYIACFEYLKQMIPFPPALVEQRLSIFSISANAILSAREAALESRDSKQSRLWGQYFTLSNILDAFEAMLTSTPTQSTITALG
jgi:AcrR family transcriptional regulator